MSYLAKRVDCLNTAFIIKTQASINGPGFVRYFIIIFFGNGQNRLESGPEFLVLHQNWTITKIWFVQISSHFRWWSMDFLFDDTVKTSIKTLIYSLYIYSSLYSNFDTPYYTQYYMIMQITDVLKLTLAWIYFKTNVKQLNTKCNILIISYYNFLRLILRELIHLYNFLFYLENMNFIIWWCVLWNKFLQLLSLTYGSVVQLFFFFKSNINYLWLWTKWDGSLLIKLNNCLLGVVWCGVWSELSIPTVVKGWMYKVKLTRMQNLGINKRFWCLQVIRTWIVAINKNIF